MKNRSMAKRIGKRCSTPVSIILSENNKWLKIMLNKLHLNVVTADGFVMLKEMMILLGEENLSVIAIDMEFLSGESALNFINESLVQIRASHPNTGVVFIFPEKNQISDAFLPSNTWTITKECSQFRLEEIVKSITSLKDDLYETSREWNVGTGIQISRIHKDKPKFTIPCPNFNIKHPSILIPIALAAKAVNAPVCFEISPQETLTYYDSFKKDCKEKVMDVLTEIRENVDFIKQYLGSQIYLHLDHCDDPEIIMHAVNIGFDSIMADGSKQGLESNIKFVNNAIRYAAKYNVLIEGEVGSIDLHGRQKSAKTSMADFEKFFRSTNADFIGVNIGQSHGSDYGFDRARTSYREAQDLNFKHRNIDPQSLYLACNQVQEEINESMRDENSLINYIKNRILSDVQFESFNELLSNYRRGSLHDEYLLAKIKNKWNINRANVCMDILTEYEKVLGINLKSNQISDDKHFLDIALLSDFNELLTSSEASLVLHGGSSIYAQELRSLKNYNVARINFGSEIFQLYLKTLTNYYQVEGDSKDLFFTRKFLAQKAGNWKEWITTPPSWLHNFKQEIISKYFEPLN